MDGGQNVPGLSLLTTERINQAFHKACEDYSPTSGSFILLTEDFYDAAIKLCGDSFMSDEPLSRFLGLRWDTQRSIDFWHKVLVQNISVGLVHKQTGELMAVRLNKWESMVDAYSTAPISDPESRVFYQFLEKCEEEAKFTEHFPYQEMYHMLGLATSPKFRKQGCATQLMAFTIRFLRLLGLPNCCLLKSEATNNYSQKVFEKNGFKCIYMKKFVDYEVDGEVVFTDTGDHSCFKIYGLCL